MLPNHPFTRLHLDALVHDAFPSHQVPDALLRLVTPKGWTEERALSVHGLLQCCLLSTALFQFEGALTAHPEGILDIRTGLRRTCQHRAHLIDALADALLTYDHHTAHTQLAEPHLRLNQTHKALHHLRAVLDVFFALRERQGFPDHPALHHLHKTTVDNAYQTLAGIVEGLTLADYRAICDYETHVIPPGIFATFSPATGDVFQPETLDNDLLHHMQDAFAQYGAVRDYPRIAVYHAMAVILIAFGLEEGTENAVTQRLKKRVQRVRHAPATT